MVHDLCVMTCIALSADTIGAQDRHALYRQGSTLARAWYCGSYHEGESMGFKN